MDHGVFGISLPSKTATIFDSGNELFSMSTLKYVGETVAAVLTHEAETANKYLDIAEITTTQNELLKTFEEETGAKFAVTNRTVADAEKEGHEKLAKGDYSSFFNFLWAYNFADGNGNAIKDEVNARNLVGLPAGDPRAAVKAYIQSKSA
jgi:hypothetical protein